MKKRLKQIFTITMIVVASTAMLSCNLTNLLTDVDLRLYIERMLDKAYFYALEEEGARPVTIISQEELDAERAEADEEMPMQPEYGTVEDVGRIEETDFNVRVYAGNPAAYSTPPTVFYANAAEYPSPPGGVVSYSAEIPVPYGAFFSVRGRGAWMQLESSEAVSAMGVMLFGDHQDGMVEVYLDDTLIWSGDTFYENCDFDAEGNRLVSPDTCHAAFDYYIEASGLEPGIHRIRVVNMTEDKEASVWYFGIGKVSP